jgi:hypothetical protein
VFSVVLKLLVLCIQMTHCIVLFENGNTIAIAPTNWLREDKVLWPLKEPNEKIVRERREPDSSYRLLEMRIIKTFGKHNATLFI